MKHGHISEAQRATKAFRERVYYWRKKGLSEDDAITRASQKLRKGHLRSVNLGSDLSISIDQKDMKLDHLKSRHQPENQEARTPKTCTEARKPQNLVYQDSVEPQSPSLILASHEPSREEIDREIEKLLSNGAVNLVRDQVNVIPFRNSRNQETRKSGSADHLAFLVRLALPITCTIAASGLLMMKTATALGSSPEAWMKAVLIEIGITSLSLRRASNVWSFLAYRMAALALICLSVFLLQTSSEKEHAAKVHQVVTGNERVTDLIGIKESLTAQLTALPTSYRTKREQLTADLKRIVDELVVAKKEIHEGGEVSVLNQSYLAESLIRLVLAALSIFFAHQVCELLQERRAVIEPA